MAHPSTRRQAFDFLYVDGQRIARIQAQFDGLGLATQNSRELLDQASVSGETNAWILKVQGSSTNEAKAIATYDPSWRLPVEFAKLGAEHGFRTLSDALPGDIVTVSGDIWLRDYEFLSDILESGVYSDRQARDFVKLPHLIHVSITEGPFKTWSTLNSACTTASTGDLVLKFGTNLPGIWTLVGVLDHDVSNHTSAPIVGQEQEVDQIVEIGHREFGRPAGWIAITPLLIYRIVRI